MSRKKFTKEFGVHPHQIRLWKKQMPASAPELFGSGENQEHEQLEQERDRLYKKVGRLQVQNDWPKKHRTSGLPTLAVVEVRGDMSDTDAFNRLTSLVNRMQELAREETSSSSPIRSPASRPSLSGTHYLRAARAGWAGGHNDKG